MGDPKKSSDLEKQKLFGVQPRGMGKFTFSKKGIFHG